VEKRSRAFVRSVVAASVTALVAGTVGVPAASAAPEDEAIWEEGNVSWIADGDTLIANLDTGPGILGTQRVRTIGVNAPETGECGAAQAEGRLRSVLPKGSRVQTRALDVASYDDYSGGRIARSLYARDQEGNWYDTSRNSVSDGLLLWFPLSAASSSKPEYAHNLEYRVLADDAAAERRGIWSANLCGSSPYPNADLRVWAKYWGTEEVYVENRSSFAVDLSGWTLRDTAISGYRTLPAGTVVPAGSVRMVFSGDMNLNNLPTDNPAFRGDAVFLMDNAGPYRTGNMRAWFPYPCNPDDCGDVLQGRVSMELVQISNPPYTTPSAPGSVTAAATTDGTGRVALSWAAPVNLGSPSVTYTVTATAVDGGAEPAPITGITGLGHTVSGLTLGRAYTFSVAASNKAGTSPATAATAPVTPSGLPGAPTAPSIEARGTSAVVSWQYAAGTAGEPPVRYTARARSATSAQTCSTTAGETSCQLDGLVEGAAYSVTVTATLGSQALTSAATSFSVPTPPSPTPSPTVTASPTEPVVDPSATATATSEPSATATTAKPDPVPSAPTDVRALPGDRRVVVSWTAPDQASTSPVEQYDVEVRPSAGGAAQTCSTDGTTSCQVTGLANGTGYVATVTATIGSQTGPASAPSTVVTPYSPITRTSAGPTAAPPAAKIWVPGEIVKVTNRSGQTVRLGGYGLWDEYSANGGSTDSARYLFPPDQVLGAGASLLVHFGSAPSTKPTAPSGSQWIWTTTGTFINTDDFVELANLNRAQIDCKTSGAGTCRGSRPVSVPTSPVGLTALASASTVTVNWGAPISSGGSPITGYTATAFDAPVGGSAVGGCTAAGTASSCSFPAAVGRTYYAEVVARNAQGTSGPSWRVRAVPKTVPGLPGSVQVNAEGTGIRVRWSAAAANGAAVTSYRASAYTAATGGSPVSSCTASGGAFECVLGGLDLGTKYFIDVSASNRVGTGTASSPRVETSALGRSTALSTYSKRRITVRWDAPAPGFAPVTGYTAKVYTKASGGKYLGKCTASATATQCRTKKLKKRKKYYIELTTHLAVGSYTASPRILTGQPRKPGRPTVLSATPADRRVVITWSPPSFTGYTYLKKYKARLYSKKKGGKSRATCYANATTTTCTTKKLKERTYYAAVRVKNSKGWSKWSKRMKVTVQRGTGSADPNALARSPEKPGRPTVVSATPQNRRVVITWSPPSFTGYTTLTKFKARLYSKKKGGKSRATCYTKAGTTTCTTKKLKKRTYYAAVRVKNSKGWSKWSKRVQVKVT